MQKRETLVRRLLETRRTVKELERVAGARGELGTLDASRLLVFRGALQALAWALDIDLAQFDAPTSLLSQLAHHDASGQPVVTPTIYRIELLGERCLWLVEIPAHTDPDDDNYSTAAWSFFLNDEQARELHTALGAALPLADTPVCTLPRLRHPAARSASPSDARSASSSASSSSARSAGQRTLAPRTMTQPDSASAVYQSFDGSAHRSAHRSAHGPKRGA